MTMGYETATVYVTFRCNSCDNRIDEVREWSDLFYTLRDLDQKGTLLCEYCQRKADRKAMEDHEAETKRKREYDGHVTSGPMIWGNSCTCFDNPPCSYCMSRNDEEE